MWGRARARPGAKQTSKKRKSKILSRISCYLNGGYKALCLSCGFLSPRNSTTVVGTFHNFSPPIDETAEETESPPNTQHNATRSQSDQPASGSRHAYETTAQGDSLNSSSRATPCPEYAQSQGHILTLASLRVTRRLARTNHLRQLRSPSRPTAFTFHDLNSSTGQSPTPAVTGEHRPITNPSSDGEQETPALSASGGPEPISESRGSRGIEKRHSTSHHQRASNSVTRTTQNSERRVEGELTNGHGNHNIAHRSSSSAATPNMRFSVTETTSSSSATTPNTTFSVTETTSSFSAATPNMRFSVSETTVLPALLKLHQI